MGIRNYLIEGVSGTGKTTVARIVGPRRVDVGVAQLVTQIARRHGTHVGVDIGRDAVDLADPGQHLDPGDGVEQQPAGGEHVLRGEAQYVPAR